MLLEDSQLNRNGSQAKGNNIHSHSSQEKLQPEMVKARQEIMTGNANIDPVLFNICLTEEHASIKFMRPILNLGGGSQVPTR